MTQKIIYFTAGAVPTPEEMAQIEALNEMSPPLYAVKVCNSLVAPNLGQRPPVGEEVGPQPILIASDFVAGTVPEDYGDIAEFDIDNPPAPPLPENQAVVSDEQVLTIGEETFTFTVEGGEITTIAVGEAA